MFFRGFVLALLVACGGCCLFQKETGGEETARPPVVSPEKVSNATQGSGKPTLDPLDPWYKDYDIPIANWEDSH